jgi:hypothetical protein
MTAGQRELSPRFLAVTAVKNEGAFLLDWIAHHVVVGFDHFLIYSNDCDDTTGEILDRLATLGVVTHVRQSGPYPKGPQWEALKQADKHPLVKTADWLMFFDVDEYVNIHVGAHRLPDLLAALPEATAIPMTWRLFGNDGVVSYRDLPVTEQFRHAAPAVMGWPWRAAMFKTLFRNDGCYRKLGVHRPRNPAPARLKTQRWFDGSGRELPELFHSARVFSAFGRDNYQIVQLNHYALGAMESYVVKCDRGRANRSNDGFDLSYWVERNFCGAEDATILALADAVAEQRAGFAADAALAGLHAQAVSWRQHKFQELMLQDAWRDLFGRLMLTPPSQPLMGPRAQYMAQLNARAFAANKATVTPEEED